MTESNQLRFSNADLARHNVGVKRPFHIMENDKTPKVNFPLLQRDCNPGFCKGLGCDNLTLAQRRIIYAKFFYRTPDEKFTIQSLLMKKGNDANFWQYELPFNGDKIRVCKTTFASTFDVSHQAIGRIQKRISSGELFPRNLKGRHTNRPHRISEEIKEAAKVHMLSYEKLQNHYSRDQQPDMIFLKPPLTIEQMYTEFIDGYRAQNITKLMSETYYRQLFHSQKLHIGAPKSDTCCKCDEYKNIIDHNPDPAKVRRAKRRKLKHLKEVEKAQKELKQDCARAQKDPLKHVCLMIDAEKTLWSPQLSCKTAYFGSKFATRNLCINNEATNEPTMYLWDQTTANIGANDVASCIFKHIRDNYVPLQRSETRELVMWSDRCVGQNNNYQMVCLYSQLVHLGYFTTVHQKFLVSGHSYNSCDRHFGLIEKRFEIQKAVYPPEFISVLKSARPENPFNVVTMTQDSFFKVDALMKYLKRPSTLKVRQVMSVKIGNGNLNEICTKSTHRAAYTTHVVTFNRRLVDVSVMPLIVDSPSYETGLLPIQGCLRKDLKTLLKFVPPHVQLWFKDKLRIGHAESEADDDESDSSSDSSAIDSSDSDDSGSGGRDSDGSDSDGSDSDGSDSDCSDSNGSDRDGSDSDGGDSDGSDNDGSDSDGGDSESSESSNSHEKL